MPAIEVVYTIVVHFIVGGAAVLVAKLGTRWSTSVYRGEWAYHMGSEAFKDKARLQLHSKSFGLKQLYLIANVLTLP